jgi:Alg9-like mannosyltransferase family
MIKRIRDRTVELFNRHPLIVSLTLGLLIRSLAAISNYGPFAIDDYQNVIDPAFRYLILGTKPDIPTLRFELLPYAFAYFMKPLYLLGVKRADFLMSFAYGVMGLISLTQVVAIHRIGTLLLETRWRNAMTFFAATWWLAPIFTNSADIAGPSYILVTFAILHLIRSVPHKFGIADAEDAASPARAFLWCGFYLSAAIFFRFSLAPLYFALAVWLLWVVPRGRKLRSLIFFALGGALTAAIMVLLELSNKKLPFSTAIEFIKYNFAEHIKAQNYGSMPWYVYTALLAIFPLPILCFFFWYPMLSAARRFGGLTVLLLAFLVSHSAIAFKLERYVIPVLPILTIYLFKGIELFADRRWIRATYRILVVINLLLILPVALTMQQRSGVDGAIYAGNLEGERFAHRVDPWRWAYYGFTRKAPRFTDKTEEIIAAAEAGKLEKFQVFRFMYFSAAELALFKTAGYECGLKRVFRPDFLERLSIRLNPAMNFRRNDTTVYSCRLKA